MARCVMTGLALLLAAMAVHGEEGRPGLYAFDLEPQPLALALQDFMRTTRHFGLYDSGLLQGVQAPAVHGSMPAAQALEILVARSGLRASYVSEDSFTLLPGAASAAPPSVPASVLPRSDDRAAYAEDAGLRIRQALCADPLTRPGTYRVAFSLWHTAQGRIEQVRLLDTSGQAARDRRLREVLQALRLAPMPPGMAPRPPLTLLVVPGQADCP